MCKLTKRAEAARPKRTKVEEKAAKRREKELRKQRDRLERERQAEAQLVHCVEGILYLRALVRDTLVLLVKIMMSSIIALVRATLTFAGVASVRRLQVAELSNMDRYVSAGALVDGAR